jgi:hypothetical protein
LNFGTDLTEETIQKALSGLSQFPSQLQPSSTTSALTDLLAEGVNHPEIKLSLDKSLSGDLSKNLQEKKNKDYFAYDENYLKELFDILILVPASENDLNYLNDWKPMMEGFHCIIIQQGDPTRTVTMPTWVEYELYTKTDAMRSLEKIIPSITVDFHSLFDFDSPNPSLASLNYGFLVSDREFIFILNSNMKPKLSVSSADDPLELLRIHAFNLLKPTVSAYYNNGHDPYQNGKDFLRGTPYTLRDGIPTVMSYGSVDHSSQFDAMTKLVKEYSDKGIQEISRQQEAQKTSSDNKIRRKLREEIVSDEQQKKISDKMESLKPSTTISKGQYFSLSLENVAVNRKMIGNVFCLLSGLESRLSKSSSSASPFLSNHYHHILLGWMMKTVFDHVGLAVKHFDASSYLLPTDTAINSMGNNERLFKEIKNDLLWEEKSLSIFRFLSNYKFTTPTTTNSNNDVYPFYIELLEQLHLSTNSSSSNSNLPSVFNEIKLLINQYYQLWNLRHDQKTSFLPISSRSSLAPSPNSPHKCAVFTITYNDREMLQLWIRYFSRHFPPSDVFVLHHHSSAFIHDRKRNQEYDSFIDGIRSKKNNDKDKTKNSFVRIIDLYGEKTGFPMFFFIRTADLYQRRFFRYGYQCTILTDVDELIIADPAIYPKGLQEYLTKFVNHPLNNNNNNINNNQKNPPQQSNNVRAHGWIVGQISQVLSKDGSPIAEKEEQSTVLIDKPFTWDLSVFSQRHYWAIQPTYSKPVLNRIPVRHYPGFHNLYFPKGQLKLDKHLILLHLRDVDRDFCLQREYMKAMIVQNTSFQSELQKGLSTHLVHYQEKLKRGEVCQYALCKYFLENQTVYDNTMSFQMSKVPPRYKQVEI